MVSEHVYQLASNFIRGGWEASCLCGWRGVNRDTQDEAYEDWDDHCDIIFMEATRHD
jgi:hypothetical protein